MCIESIHLKNFKSFKDVTFKNIPKFCVLVGANGSGKSAFFQIFAFLKDAMRNNITTALTRLGGQKGISEVRSRHSEGPIGIELKFRETKNRPIITYQLHINDENGKPFVEKEILMYFHEQTGTYWRFLQFNKGKGYVVTNEMMDIKKETELKREDQTLISQDILAIKGLALYEKFPTVRTLGNLIESWPASDIFFTKTRGEVSGGVAEHLSSQGENLAEVAYNIHKNHPDKFKEILEILAQRVPDISNVEPLVTEYGKVLLKFKDGSFKDPFLSDYMSDGTIKMFAYLLLLYNPSPPPILCLEEPENNLYPKILGELAEEFRLYAEKGSQVIVSTHSPDFLNSVNPDEIYWLKKIDGFTTVEKASSNLQIMKYVNEGDKMGYLWREGSFEGVDPL
jgi:predicted ATPase